jgi:uncharacterized protein (TIGR03083 family)
LPADTGEWSSDSSEWDVTRIAFADAAAWFVETAARVEDQWDSPGLGEWTIRDLVGHTSRSFITVEFYLDDEVGDVELRTPAEYFQRVMASVGDPAAVAQRGRDAGAVLGSSPAQAVAEIASRVLQLVQRSAPDAQLQTPAGRMRLADYLPTRTFELTVHTCDLAVALGIHLTPPHSSTVASMVLAGDLVVARGDGAGVLLALTGRRPLPDGYTAL